MKCQRCEEAEIESGEFCDHCLKMMHVFSGLVARPQRASTTANRRSGKRGGYRHASESLAVEPEQVAEVRELYAKSGVGDIEHTPDGRPVFTSDQQFQRANMARGFKTGRDGYDELRQECGR